MSLSLYPTILGAQKTDTGRSDERISTPLDSGEKGTVLFYSKSAQFVRHCENEACTLVALLLLPRATQLRTFFLCHSIGGRRKPCVPVIQALPNIQYYSTLLLLMAAWRGKEEEEEEEEGAAAAVLLLFSLFFLPHSGLSSSSSSVSSSVAAFPNIKCRLQQRSVPPSVPYTDRSQSQSASASERERNDRRENGTSH